MSKKRGQCLFLKDAKFNTLFYQLQAVNGILLSCFVIKESIVVKNENVELYHTMNTVYIYHTYYIYIYIV